MSEPAAVFSSMRNLSVGSTGQDVADIQQSLNNRLPTIYALLEPDGIFGQKTDARVREFQRNNGLVVDGIVGPYTRAALAGENTPPDYLSCDCCNPEMIPVGSVREFADYFQKSKIKSALRSGPGVKAAAPSAAASGPLRMLTDDQKNLAKTVYGESLDFSTVFISNKRGAQGRPFTLAFPGDNETVQIMNLGTYDPDRKLLIHELGHVWQSQHHSNKYLFMYNAVNSMKEAMKSNVLAVTSDPIVSLNKNFPTYYPFDAYAYDPTVSFSSLAAEQMAQALENGEPGIVAHIKAVTRNTVDSACVAALSKPRYGDRRVSGIK